MEMKIKIIIICIVQVYGDQKIVQKSTTFNINCVYSATFPSGSSKNNFYLIIKSVIFLMDWKITNLN